MRFVPGFHPDDLGRLVRHVEEVEGRRVHDGAVRPSPRRSVRCQQGMLAHVGYYGTGQKKYRNYFTKVNELPGPNVIKLFCP
jgi:hypothetical protein